jgi:hypothetical protein
MAEKGQIPAFRIGSVLHARRSTLLRFVEERERTAFKGEAA